MTTACSLRRDNVFVDPQINAAISRPEPSTLLVRMVTDPPGRTVTPALARLCVAVHVGPAVYMVCKRGDQRHSGLGVHGDIDVIPAFTECVWEPKTEDTALVLALDPSLPGRIAEEYGKDAARVEIRNRFQIRDLQMENIGWALKAEMEAGYPSGRVFCESLGTAMAAHLLSRHSSLANLPEPSNSAMGGHTLKRVLAFIEESLARDLSLSEIAAMAGLSVSHFKVMFRKSMGVPVHQYLVRRRVETAALMLRQTNAPISQIAQDTGFAHQSHLSHHMRRVLGYSPKAIRNLTS